MAFLSLVPQAPLRHLVEMIWDWEGASRPYRLERILPVANAGLIFNLAENETRTYDERRRCTRHSASTLDGPRTSSCIIDTDEQVATMGVMFRPGGATLFFRERMDALANGSIDLEDLAGSDACLLREQLLEANDAQSRMARLERWLQRRAVAESPTCVVRQALAALQADPRMATLAATARDAGLSPRLLSDRFRQSVGLTPKRYLRLQRFHRVIKVTQTRERIDWAGVALDCGYSDQAHLSHEFREFSGLTPTAFSHHRGEWSGHIALE